MASFAVLVEVFAPAVGSFQDESFDTSWDITGIPVGYLVR
jgi:hypothetical protein